MKYVLIALAILFSVAFASADSKNCSTETSNEEVQEQLEIKTDVPEYLKGATITVTLKDGRSSTVPAEKFKVVPRKQQFITTKTAKNTTTTCSVEEIDRHRVSLLGGRGTKSGLHRNNDEAPDRVTVENRVGAVLGAQYQYKTDLKVLDMPLSIGVQGQTNKTGSILLGVDF